MKDLRDLKDLTIHHVQLIGDPPALRVAAHRPFQLPRFVHHITGFRQAPVHIKGLKKAI